MEAATPTAIPPPKLSPSNLDVVVVVVGLSVVGFVFGVDIVDVTSDVVMFFGSVVIGLIVVGSVVTLGLVVVIFGDMVVILEDVVVIFGDMVVILLSNT